MYVHDTSFVGSSVEDIQIVREFLNVLHEELSRLPLDREFEFGIEVLLGTAPITIAPYRMTSMELKELKV